MWKVGTRTLKWLSPSGALDPDMAVVGSSHPSSLCDGVWKGRLIVGNCIMLAAFHLKFRIGARLWHGNNSDVSEPEAGFCFSPFSIVVCLGNLLTDIYIYINTLYYI